MTAACGQEWCPSSALPSAFEIRQAYALPPDSYLVGLVLIVRPRARIAQSSAGTISRLQRIPEDVQNDNAHIVHATFLIRQSNEAARRLLRGGVVDEGISNLRIWHHVR